MTGFDQYDEGRLVELLGDGFEPFSPEEKQELAKIPAVIIDDEWFQDYSYLLDNQAETKITNFYNPETLKNNHWLHTKKVISTSPFKNAVVFTTDTPTVESVTVSPQQSTVSAGLDVQLSALVETKGFANKSVTWSITQYLETEPAKKATIDLNGKVHIPAGHVASTKNQENTLIKVTATSVYDNTKTGTASITVL